ADITIGRAARLVDGARSAAGFLYEPYVWSQRRTFDSVEQFDDVIHDCFYWNKVFRTGFLRAHGLGMDPGLLYADRPFVHRAYWHSRRDRKSTRLNSSHVKNSYAVFCLKKKTAMPQDRFVCK